MSAPRVAALHTAILALTIASGCTKANDTAPPPAHEQAQVVQNALALPPSAAPAPPPAGAAHVATATVPPTPPTPPTPSSAPAGTELSMEHVLGVPPTLPSPSKPIHQGAAPHLFHLGASGFFLDHPEIALTVEQRSKLSAIRETAGLGYATAQRKIDQAEQELWSITSAEHPSASRVEAKLTEIARLSTRQRMDYILAIGQAVAQLTDAQHGMLASPPTGAAAPSAVGSGASGSPMPMPTPPPSANGSAAMPMPANPPGMPMGSGSAKPMGHM